MLLAITLLTIIMHNIPVIVLSGTGDMDNVVRCVELGAEDFLPKPFNPLLLRTRIAAGLEKKRLRDQEQAFLQQISTEREKSERLLLNVLPAAIAERLKQGEATIAESYPDVTVIFADLVNFTQLSERTPAPQLVELLNEVFSDFDRMAERHGLEKIKTIGDSYMAVGGLPMPCANHAERVARIGRVHHRLSSVPRNRPLFQPPLSVGHSHDRYKGIAISSWQPPARCLHSKTWK